MPQIVERETELKEDRRIYVMSQEKPIKAIIKMGVPVTLGMLFMVVYNWVDAYFIGLLKNDYQLAATNFAYPVMMILIAVSGIVGNGGASYIARCIGAGDKRKAEHTLTIGFGLVIVSGIIISLSGIIFADPIVTLLGAKEKTFQYTKEYVIVTFAGAVFIMGNYAVGQLLRSEGSTFYSMVGMIAGTAANIILDPVFIFAFRLEITGAAIATVLGNAVSVCVYLYYYFRKKTLLLPSVKLMRFDGGIIREIMWVGIPHTLEQFFTTAAMIVNNNLAAAYGESVVAAMGISNKIMTFGSYVYQGMTAGSQPLMGYNYGAENYKRLKKLIRSGIYAITMTEIFIMTLYGVFAPYFIAVFSDTADVIKTGAQTLRAAMLALPFAGVTSMCRNTFNSIGKPIHAFSVTIVRQLILYVPLLIIFNRIWGYGGLIHAQPAEEAVCAAFSLLLLFGYIRRFEK